MSIIVTMSMGSLASLRGTWNMEQGTVPIRVFPVPLFLVPSSSAAHALGDVLLRREEDADARAHRPRRPRRRRDLAALRSWRPLARAEALLQLRHRRLVLPPLRPAVDDRKSTRLNSSHGYISY